MADDRPLTVVYRPSFDLRFIRRWELVLPRKLICIEVDFSFLQQ